MHTYGILLNILKIPPFGHTKITFGCQNTGAFSRKNCTSRQNAPYLNSIDDYFMISIVDLTGASTVEYNYRCDQIDQRARKV